MDIVRNPVRLVPLAFLAAIILGTSCLMLPFATAPGQTTHLIDAAFTIVSATCVTGLVTVDTATHWTVFGQVIIIMMIQAGGFGMMTLATFLAFLARHRLSLTTSMGTQNETHTSLADARRLPSRIALAMFLSELVITIVLTLRFRLHYGLEWGSAVWRGAFHAISAFNNAGFALYSDNVMSFSHDWLIVFPLCCAVVAGGLGFPVYFELSKNKKLLHPKTWSVHSRLTVTGTIILLAVGFFAFLLVEWRNPGTIGSMSLGDKALNGIAASVFPRTAGFQTIDYANVRPETLLVHYGLMFIGGGSAGTAGGIKVGTFFLLLYVMRSEVHGSAMNEVGNRQIDHETVRQAVTVVLMSLGLVALGTFIILSATHFTLDVVLFEAISAFATVGLSVNLTPLMPPVAKIVLMVLMFCGRVGPVTVVAAMAANRRHHKFSLPKEHPIVG